MKVNFHEVGRNKKSWSYELKEVTEDAIAREAKRNGGLLSSIVEAEIHDNGKTGEIIVGGWRSVGQFTIG